ncbi:MAG: dephospho-CoA kinase [Fimbriimonadales bacterium]
MECIAITGGVAEGKTTVLNLFRELGALTLSADAVVASLMRPGTDLWDCLIQQFGNEVVGHDGTLQRDRLAGLAFADLSTRRKLNALVHPAVVREIQRWLVQQPPSPFPRIVEVPLLVEVAWQGWFDGIIVVRATPSLQRQRLQARGLPSTIIQQILRAQLPTRCKVPFADWQIRTHRSLGWVAQQVHRLWREWGFIP